MIRRCWISAWVLALVVGSSSGPLRARQAEVVGPGRVAYGDDFEQPGALATRWQALGPVRASRVPVEGGRPIPGASGHALRVEAHPRSELRSNPLPGGPRLNRCERFVVRVNAESAGPGGPVVFEVQFLVAGRRAWWWRKVSVDRPGWLEVDLPLSDFRPGPGAVPAWEEVDRLGFAFRTDATLLIDGIELTGGGSEEAAYLSLDQLRQAAFGADRPARTLRRDPFVLLTDAPGLDGERVLDALAEMERRTRADFPTLPAPRRPVPLLIFSDVREYRRFWPRFAGRFEAQAKAPESDGFTSLGIASSACAADPKTVRPVFVHEASHALMTSMLGLDNSGEWLFEGLATRYQLAFSRQDIRPIVRDGLADARRRTAFADLLDGRPIPGTRYWQVALVIDWLLDDPGRKDGFLAALAAMRASGSTDLRPLAREHLGVPLDQLEAAWLEWARLRSRP